MISGVDIADTINKMIDFANELIKKKCPTVKDDCLRGLNCIVKKMKHRPSDSTVLNPLIHLII